MSQKSKTNLDKCLKIFDMSISEFSKFSEINYQTLTGWDKSEKVSPLGDVALENIIRCKKLKDELKKQDTNQELQNFRTIRDILKKY